MIKSKVFGSYDPNDEGYTEKFLSQTNPDDATHRKVMMGSVLHGIEHPTNRMKQHDGEQHIPDFSRMDYSQFFDYVDRVEGALQDNITLKKAEAAKAAKAKADKAMEDLKLAAIEEYKKTQSQTQS